jgi:PIN domain nuclease of toxin-antitoxin system
MKLILDTHTFLWFVSGATELSNTARQSIENKQYTKFISIASLWEICIKTSLGKLTVKDTYGTLIDDIEENGFEILSISFPHTVVQHGLPFHHKDPFDRMIISQAIHENMNVIGRDIMFDPYLANTPVKRIW